MSKKPSVTGLRGLPLFFRWSGIIKMPFLSRSCGMGWVFYTFKFIAKGSSMEFLFHPADEEKFKEQAVNKFVRTVVFDVSKNEVVISYTRKVSKVWEQTCKNNIETDHRIKRLSGDNYQIYSWITNSERDFGLPCFTVK